MSHNPKNPRPIITEQNLILSNYSPKKRISLSFPEDSEYTKQEFKQECDINNILNKYAATGEIPNLNHAPPQYLDVSSGHDFQAAMEYVAGAQSLFQDMPANIRARFGNDPAQFLDFCSHEKNRPELAEMGLLRPTPAPVIPVADLPPSNAPAPKTEEK